MGAQKGNHCICRCGLCAACLPHPLILLPKNVVFFCCHLMGHLLEEGEMFCFQLFVCKGEIIFRKLSNSTVTFSNSYQMLLSGKTVTLPSPAALESWSSCKSTRRANAPTLRCDAFKKLFIIILNGYVLGAFGQQCRKGCCCQWPARAAPAPWPES